MLTGMLISKNVSVWFIFMDMERAKTPAVSIMGFFDRSSLVSDMFSGNASANAMTAPESSCVSDKFKLSIFEFLDKVVFNDKIYYKSLNI